MSEAGNLFTLLRQSVDGAAAAAIEELVQDAPDRALSRVNVLDFAAKTGVDQESAIAAFLHAARLGIFELSWNVLCPGCGGVLDTGTTLRSVNKEEYDCGLCAAGYQPTLDEMVEVTFTVSRRVRRIAAHDPDELSFAEYFRQIFWGSGIDVPDDFEQLIEEIVLDQVELPPGEKALLSLQLPAEFVLVSDPCHARDSIPGRKGRADARTSEPIGGFRQVARADRYAHFEAGSIAPVARKSHRHANLARLMGRRRQIT